MTSGESMERTTIMLPHDLKLRVAQYAKKQGISMGELIRNVMDAALNNPHSNSFDDDPLFSDKECYTGDVPNDISQNHNQYLYGKSVDFS